MFLISHHDSLLKGATHLLRIPDSLPIGTPLDKKHFLKPEIQREKIVTKKPNTKTSYYCAICDLNYQDSKGGHDISDEHLAELKNWLIL